LQKYVKHDLYKPTMVILIYFTVNHILF